MALGASDFFVAAVEHKAGQLVVELPAPADFVPTRDVLGAPFVFGVAGRTGFAFVLRMQAFVLCDLLRERLMVVAVQTQLRRHAAAELVAFFAAGALVPLRVRLRQRFRRQIEEILRVRELRREEAKGNRTPQAPAAPPISTNRHAALCVGHIQDRKR